MAKKRLDVPTSAFEVKADYRERPPRALVSVIKQFIEQTGAPHLWPGHTHTKPPKGSRVTFLTKYSLPATHRRRERWAPCPCCSPWHPKYFRQGLIAWFPEEGVIRCVGDKCYKSMDPEGYALAMEKLNAEIEAERTTDFLLTRLPKVPEYLHVLQFGMPALKAIDDMLNRLRALLDKTFAIDLWPHVSTGLLRYTVTRKELIQSRDGKEEERTFADFQDYGTINGYTAVAPGVSKFASRLGGRMHNLGVLDFGSELEARVLTMTETEMDRASKILSHCHKDCVHLCEQAEEARRFFAPVNVSTINGWSRQEGAALRIHLKLSEEGLYVARDAEQSHSFIRWPENFWSPIRKLEPLSRTQAA